MDANASAPLLEVTAEEADLAYEKVENYLRACRLSGKLSRARLAAHFVNEAARECGSLKSPAVPGRIESAAIEKAQSYISKWVFSALPEAGQAGMSLPETFLLIYLSDIEGKFPGKFLAEGEVPSDIKTLFRKRIIRTGPSLEVSSMVPREIDMGVLHELADSTMSFLNKWPFIKIIAAWLFFIFALVLFFFYTRGKVL